METHHELVGYIRCGDRQALVAALVARCEREGLRLVDDVELPVLAPIPSRDGLFSVAVLPGVPGWHVVSAWPEAFLCERVPGAERSRFVDLCDALRSPGMLCEANGGEAVYGYGNVTLEADGDGRYALTGYMWRTEYQDADPADNLHLTWFGHQLDEDKMEAGFQLVADAMPATWPEPVTRWHSDIQQAMICGHAAHHLAGPETSRYWAPEAAWYLVRHALAIGGYLPVPGGIILTFAPASIPVPASAPQELSVTVPPDRELPGFRYADGTPIGRGDEVRCSNGDKAIVTGLLVRNGAAGEEPGGVCIDGANGNYVVDPAYFHTLQLMHRSVPADTLPSWDELERRVAQNDAAAQHAVGVIHKQGDGVKRNALRAANWFRKAAEQGHAAAQYELGRAYYLAEGVPEDWRESLRWMEAAAAQDQRDALRFLVARLGGDGMHRLNLYRRETGLPEDMPQVVELLERLAQQGEEGAQFELAQLFSSGKEMAPDLARAKHWYRQAAEQGHPESARRLADLVARDGGEA